MCRVDDSRRDVQRLSACAARGLHGRAYRIPFPEKQSRCIALDHRDIIGLGFRLGRVSQCPRKRVVSERLKSANFPCLNVCFAVDNSIRPEGLFERVFFVTMGSSASIFLFKVDKKISRILCSYVEWPATPSMMKTRWSLPFTRFMRASW